MVCHDLRLTPDNPQDLPVSNDEDDQRQEELPDDDEHPVALPDTTVDD